MCGIAGILSLDGRPVVAEDIKSMCSAIVHRGPDDEGFFVRGDVGLGMRRLSIIDLHTGHQPICNEDGSVWVVFNGEIYNFESLRRQLIQHGHRLSTRTDTEVIVHLYEDFGADLVKHLRGMFAFALWDSNKRRLLLGRDRLGIKPLYYGHLGGRFVFASELKAILQLTSLDRQFDWGAVNYLFTTLTTPGTQSIIRGIHKLEPAHVLTIGPNTSMHLSRYWDVQFEPNRQATEQELVEELREKVDECVRIHMISDVPVGAFLSGGIDSSSVVAHMVRHTDRPVKTFAIGFNEAAFNELPYARAVAQHFSTDHHERVVGPDVVGLLQQIAWHLDEPFGDASAIPTFLVSQAAAEHVKVVLSGDGGDELFAGYDKYRVEQRERRYSRLPHLARRALRHIGASLPEGATGRNFMMHHSLTGWDRYLDAGAFFRERQRQELFHVDVLAQMEKEDPLRDAHRRLARHANWLSAVQDLDLQTYLPLDILTKVDRMSMAHSLEVRVPLLDHKLVEFAATIPPELNLNGVSGKRVFKKAMRGILPDQVIDRPKRGFAVPLAFWFRGELEGFARDLLLSRRSRERNILNIRYVERLLDLHRGGRPLDLQLWTLISLELWCRTFIDRRSSSHVRVSTERSMVAAGAPA
ncbi:MAG TPA: asparagine synthase (glutamine-hydrolyzing) [Thermoanaerobaculia bacterium]|jgi:asparagine synthase (glutamine-hydrolysing)